MSSQDNQNIWFGVAMFLLGLIAGAALVFMTGGSTTRTVKNDVTAPTKQAPQVSVDQRIQQIVSTLGLDQTAFTACTQSKKYDAKIADQQSAGQAAGISGTPGNIVYDLKSKKAIAISGAQPFESFQKVIDEMLQNPSTVTGEELKNVPNVDFQTDHVRGTQKAKVAIIEYSDFQCPFCQRVHPTYQKILATYGDDVVWVFRHFPLSFHPDAMPLAVGSECANELGGSKAFWDYTDAVFQ